MIPILYERDETEFKSNGLGRLYDCITCTVTEELNGVYECDFTYPVGGMNYYEILPGRIIACRHDYSDDVQPFDIVSYSKPINGVVTFHAVHISYRQSSITAYGTNVNSLASAFAVLGNGKPNNPFNYETDITGSGYVAAFDGVPRSVKELLGGIEGSILDTFHGEYEFDKFTTRLLKARGIKKDVTIRYGVNMLDYTDDIDYSETYDACIPYWTGQDDYENDVVVRGNQVTASDIPTYNGRVNCVPLDLTDKFEGMPTSAQLEAMARSYINSNQPYLPTRSITVDFVRIQDMSEYDDYEHLLDCNLGDSVTVIFPRYGMEGDFKIVRIEFDVLLERYGQLDLGNPPVTLANALGLGKGSPFRPVEGVGTTISMTSTVGTTVSENVKKSRIGS